MCEKYCFPAYVSQRMQLCECFRHSLLISIAKDLSFLTGVPVVFIMFYLLDWVLNHSRKLNCGSFLSPCQFTLWLGMSLIQTLMSSLVVVVFNVNIRENGRNGQLK